MDNEVVVKISLICSECGNDVWIRTKGGHYVCLSCGKVYNDVTDIEGWEFNPCKVEIKE